MKNKSLENKRRLMYLEVVSGDRSFLQLYVKRTRAFLLSEEIMEFPKEYKWVDGIRREVLKKGYIELKKGNNYKTITPAGLEYLNNLKS